MGCAKILINLIESLNKNQKEFIFSIKNLTGKVDKEGLVLKTLILKRDKIEIVEASAKVKKSKLDIEDILSSQILGFTIQCACEYISILSKEELPTVQKKSKFLN